MVLYLIKISPSNILQKCYCLRNIIKIARPVLAALSVNGLNVNIVQQ